MPAHEHISNSRRRFRAACALLGFAALLTAVCALPRSVPLLRQHGQFFKRVRAALRGASFVGEADVVFQSHGNDCGVAALQMILAAHGIECSAAALVPKLRLTPRGTSMLDMRRAAAEFGVPAKSWVIKPVDLSQTPLPAIALVNGDHFVVIRRFIAPEVLEVDDPALGRLRWPMRAFTRAWSGETLVFDPAWTPL